MYIRSEILNYCDIPSFAQVKNSQAGKRILCSILLIFAAVSLSACGDKEKKIGQALVSVNGEEITVHQLNEELQRSGVQANQQEAASKKLLEALIDRQLLESEAIRDKTDRDPKVMQAIERAKSQIIAQAYLQKRLTNMDKPSQAEVDEYFQTHPELFSQRKQFDMAQLIIATKDWNDELKAVMDSPKSIEEVASWLDAQKVQYVRNQISRSTTDMPRELSIKLLAMEKNQLFVVKEGERTTLVALIDTKDSPVAATIAAPQIQQYLFNKKNKEAADAEIARLRAAAKIEYFNKSAEKTPEVQPPLPAPATQEVKPSSATTDINIQKGVAGLK